jgi:hypothetical protein
MTVNNVTVSDIWKVYMMSIMYILMSNEDHLFTKHFLHTVQ